MSDKTPIFDEGHENEAEKNLLKAEEEILARVARGDLSIPDNATNALRLLAEYWIVAETNFQPKPYAPDVFAMHIYIIAFAESFAPSVRWPYTHQQMGQELRANGLTGIFLEILGMPVQILEILVGADTYKPSLLQFDPPLKDMHLIGETQSHSHSRVVQTSNGMYPTARAEVMTKIGQEAKVSASVSVSCTGARTSTGINGETVVTEVEGLPSIILPTVVLEKEDTTFYDGGNSQTTTRRSKDGISVEREVRMKSPRRQNDALKRLEEKTAGELFIHAYNRVNNTKYVIESVQEQDDSKDLIAKTPNSQTALTIQVRKCSDRPVWKALATISQYQDTMNEQQAIDEVLAAIRDKFDIKYVDADKLILLLDGAWTGFTNEVLQAVRCLHASTLADAGFREIWYVSRISRDAFRLFP